MVSRIVVRRLFVCSFVCVGAFLASARIAHADSPGVFSYGWKGFGGGVLLGASVGYLATHDDDWSSEDWEDLGIGTAIGAVSGAVLGLGIGIFDLTADNPGYGHVILRDMFGGILFGVAVGGFTGAIVWATSGNGSALPTALAIGALAGAPLGIALGFLEGPPDPKETEDQQATARAPGRGAGFTLTVARVGPPGNGSWLPAVAGVF